jgi:hypothetical protein
MERIIPVAAHVGRITFSLGRKRFDLWVKALHGRKTAFSESERGGQKVVSQILQGKFSLAFGAPEKGKIDIVGRRRSD